MRHVSGANLFGLVILINMANSICNLLVKQVTVQLTDKVRLLNLKMQEPGLKNRTLWIPLIFIFSFISYGTPLAM